MTFDTSQNMPCVKCRSIYLNKNNPKDFIYEGANQFGLYFCMIVGFVMLIFSAIYFFINKIFDDIIIPQLLLKYNKEDFICTRKQSALFLNS